MIATRDTYMDLIVFLLALCASYTTSTEDIEKRQKCVNEIAASISYRNEVLKFTKTGKDLFDLIQCADTYCHGKARCSENIDLLEPRCHCDELCTVFKDCCMDYGENNSTWNGAVLADLGEEFFRQSLHCSNSLRWLSRVESEYHPGIQMVDACPNFVPQSLTERVWKNLCERHRDIPPLHLSLLYWLPMYDITTNLTFKNVFCALCNGVNVSTPFWYDLLIVTEYCVDAKEPLSNHSLSEELEKLLLQHECPYIFLPPASSVLRPCIKDREILGDTGENFYEAFSYWNPVTVYGTDVIYRNIFENMVIESRRSNMRALLDTHLQPLTAEDLKSFECEELGRNKTIFPNENLLTAFGAKLKIHMDAKQTANILTAIKSLGDTEDIVCDGNEGHDSNEGCDLFVQKQHSFHPIEFKIQLRSYGDVSQVALLKVTAFIHQLLLTKPINEKLEITALNVSRGKWNEGELDCFVVDIGVYVRTKGWLNDHEVDGLIDWFHTFDLRFEEENPMSFESYIFFRYTSNIAPKLPKCLIYSSGRETLTPLSPAISANLFEHSKFDLYFRTDKYRSCQSLYVKFTNVYVEFDNQSTVELIIENLTCSNQLLSIAPGGFDKENSNALKYFTMSISVFIILSTLLYNLPKIEYGTIPSKGFTQLLLLQCCALSCYMICPTARQYTRTGDIFSFLLHYCWLSSFTWCSNICIYLWHLMINVSKTDEDKPESDPHFSSVIMRIFTALAYFLPAVVLIPIVVFKTCKCSDRLFKYDGFSCMPTDSVIVLMSYGFPAFMTVILSSVSIFLAKKAISDLPMAQPWMTYRILCFVMTFYISGMALSWTVGLVAIVMNYPTIWQLFLVVQMFWGCAVSFGFLFGRSYNRIVNPRPKDRPKW